MMLMILMYFLDDFDDGKNNARTLGFPILAATISLPKMTGGVPSAPTDSAPPAGIIIITTIIIIIITIIIIMACRHIPTSAPTDSAPLLATNTAGNQHCNAMKLSETGLKCLKHNWKCN